MTWVNLGLVALAVPVLASAVLISSPFDNFRIECPQGSGAQRLSVRMVESQGMKRQDTVFSLSCNNIDEIYPWREIPQGIVEIEREDCHYTRMFDPIMDTNMTFSCGPREYMTGISRVTDTRIQVMCCRTRSRDEANCETSLFGKPVGFDGKSEIQLRGKLINSFSILKNIYQVRFCDLVPRDVARIMADVKVTTTRAPTTTRSTTTPSTTTTSEFPTTTEELTSPLPTEPTSPKRVIKIQRPAFTVNSEDRVWSSTAPTVDDITADDVTESDAPSSDKAAEIEKSSEDKVLSPVPIASSVEVSPSPMPKENAFPSDKDYENIEEAEAALMSTIADMMKARQLAKNLINRVKASGVKQQAKDEQEKMAEQMIRDIENERDTTTADELVKQSVEMLNELSEAKAMMSAEQFSQELMRQSSAGIAAANQNEDAELAEPVVESEIPEEVLRAASSSIEARRAPSKHLATLPPLNNFPSPPPPSGHKAPVELPRYPNRPSHYVEPVVDFEEYDELLRPTTRFAYRPRWTTRSPRTTVSPHTVASARGSFLDQPYVDEETRASPFEKSVEKQIHRHQSPTTTVEPAPIATEATTEASAHADRKFVYGALFRANRPMEGESPFEIRRSPLPRVSGNSGFQKYDDLSEENDVKSASFVPKFDEELIKQIAQQIMRDGVRNYQLPDDAPAPMPSMPAYDVMETLEPMTKPSTLKDGETKKKIKSVQRNTEMLVPLAAIGQSEEADVTMTPNFVVTELPILEPEVVSEEITTVEVTTIPSTTTTSTTPTTTTEAPTTTTEEPETTTMYEVPETKPYDPSDFYHTLPPRRNRKPERYLTFCTKQLAIRDINNMIVACGDGTDVWEPSRCPPGTACFYTTDSDFRICCPVAQG